MVKVAIVGASGYTGAELLRIMSVHPKAEVAELYARKNAGKKAGEVFPHLPKKYANMLLKDLESDSRDADTYFVCVPHGSAQPIVADLLSRGKKVVDLSADYRIKDVSIYEKYYRVAHNYGRELKSSVYGMPEFFEDEIAEANLVANPGCLARASLLALGPLYGDKLINLSQSPVIDAKTGVSGAGRRLKRDILFPEMNEDIRPYSPIYHRHVPEIEQFLKNLSNREIKVIFVPHIASFDRGILASVYLRVVEEIEVSDIGQTYLRYYGDSPFIKLVDLKQLPSVKRVRGSNTVEISFSEIFDKNLVVFVALDNLMSGASGNAVQCFNLMHHFDPEAGLRNLPPLYP